MTPLTFSVGRHRRRFAVAAAAALFAVATRVEAQQGRIAVRVTDAATQQPVAQAQVQIVGTTLGGLTGADGRAVIRGIAPATHQVRVLRVGYAEQKKQVTVTGTEEGQRWRHAEESQTRDGVTMVTARMLQEGAERRGRVEG